MNGNSGCSNSNSFAPQGDGRDLPYWFRARMPVPPTLLIGA
jgi:hypothetical protein